MSLRRSGDRGSGPAASRLARVVLLGAALYAVLAQGAFYRHQAILFWSAVLFAGGLAAFGAVVSSRRRHLTSGLAEARWAIPLILSAVSSAALADDFHAAVPTLLTIAAVTSAYLVARLGTVRGTRWLVSGFITVGLAAAATATVGTLHRHEPWGRLVNGLWRGSSSITYSNAAAALIIPMLLVVVARISRDNARRFDIVVAHLLLVGAIATLSRGGAVGLIVGLGAMWFMIGLAPLVKALVPVVAGAAISSVAVVVMVSESIEWSPVWAWGAIAIGLAVSIRTGNDQRSAVRFTVVAFPMLVLGLLAVVALAAATGSGTAIADRLNPGDPYRAGEWSAAWSEFASAPIVGVGPGRAEFAFEVDGQGFHAEFAHQEFLELAAEQGLVGLAALVVPIAMILLGLARRASRDVDALSAGLFAAVVAFLAHSSLDFLWHIPLLPVAISTLAGAALVDSADGNQVSSVERQRHSDVRPGR